MAMPALWSWSFSQLGVLRDNALQEALPRCSRLRALDLSLCPSLSAAAGSIVADLTRTNPGSPFWQTVNVLIGAAVAATFPLQLLPAIAPLEANCCAPGRCAGVAVPYSKVCVVVGLTAVAYLVPEVELRYPLHFGVCDEASPAARRAVL